MTNFKACLDVGGGPRVGEVTRLAVVDMQSYNPASRGGVAGQKHGGERGILAVNHVLFLSCQLLLMQYFRLSIVNFIIIQREGNCPALHTAVAREI